MNGTYHLHMNGSGRGLALALALAPASVGVVTGFADMLTLVYADVSIFFDQSQTSLDHF